MDLDIPSQDGVLGGFGLRKNGEEVVLGVSKLEDDEATVAELGINAGTEVQVLFSILPGPKLTLETFLSCLFVCSWLKPTLAD